MKKLLTMILVISLFSAHTLFAEEAKVVIEANPIEFPYIKIKAYVLDSKGEPITGIKSSDIKIQESGFKIPELTVKEKAPDAVEPIDIVFVFDTTGSMSKEIKSVRDNIIEFANVLKKTNMDYRLGLITFGDKVRKVYEPMADVNKFKEIISRLKARGGNDKPENALDAMFQMTKFKFREKAKVVAVLITDAPYHMNNHITKLHTLTVLKPVKEKGIVVYTLAPRLEQYKWIAAETGGVYHDVTKNFTELVYQLAASLTAQYVIEYKTLNPEADARKRSVKLILGSDSYKGSSKVSYRAPGNLSVSSYLIEKNRPKNAYAPENVFDGKKTTAWFEASPDDGIGEWLKVTFSKSKKINKIGILGGYPKTNKLFKKNNRIKTAMLIFSNGDTQILKFKDTKKMQYFNIETKQKTSYVKIVINSVYRGTRYRDTCITELDFK
ncbi:MAG: VWA domain-containing protein [Desulfobacterales bacterium]|nr:VWA domain-containing protein [Desulfobacterales bacterium]MCP4160546.1 VWA domain-containing protein [Deltaproteobacteria bacterium]